MVQQSMTDASQNTSTSSYLIKPEKKAPRKRRQKPQWRKPKGMPKRPLSAYNLFFAEERKRLIAQHNDGKQNASATSDKKGLGFAGLARTVAAAWKVAEPTVKARFQEQSEIERVRYRNEMVAWESHVTALRQNDSSSEELHPYLADTSSVRTNVSFSSSNSCGHRSVERKSQPKVEKDFEVQTTGSFQDLNGSTRANSISGDGATISNVTHLPSHTVEKRTAQAYYGQHVIAGRNPQEDGMKTTPFQSFPTFDSHCPMIHPQNWLSPSTIHRVASYSNPSFHGKPTSIVPVLNPEIQPTRIFPVEGSQTAAKDLDCEYPPPGVWLSGSLLANLDMQEVDFIANLRF